MDRNTVVSLLVDDRVILPIYAVLFIVITPFSYLMIKK